MAENVRETDPPEPPPKALEAPKPTAQSSRVEAKEEQGQPPDSQEAAHREARNAAQSEHAEATGGREPVGSHPAPEVQARLDQHTPAKDAPGGPRPTPEFLAGLDAHAAAKADRRGPGHQDAAGAPQQADQPTAAGDRQSRSEPDEQTSEHAAARRSATAEYTKANLEVIPGETSATRALPPDATRQTPPPQEKPYGELNQPADPVGGRVQSAAESPARPDAAVQDTPQTTTGDQHFPEQAGDGQEAPPAGEKNGDQPAGGTADDRLPREAPDAGAGGRVQPAETGAVGGAGGEWETIDEQPGGAVGQIHPLSCTSACGEMLSGLPQAELIEKLGLPAMQGHLAKELGSDWRALAVDPGQPEAVRYLCENGPWAADLWNSSEGIHHTVVVDGVDDNNQVSIRDPWDGGSTYQMSWNEFDRVWCGVAVVNRRTKG